MAYRYYLFIVGAGLALGLISANALIESRPFSSVRQGGWTTVPTVGEERASPYDRAYRFKHGLLAVSGKDSLSFHTKVDSNNRPLDANCTYRLTGSITYSGWWSLHTRSETVDATRKLPGWAEGAALNSLTAVQNADKSFEVLISQTAKPGNWLKLSPDARRFELVLTVYEAPFLRDALRENIALPALSREACQ